MFIAVWILGLRWDDELMQMLVEFLNEPKHAPFNSYLDSNVFP